ncbi:MAG: Smr/MutS family protein [Myxococcales bacterium]|nr:Smr/MutS family protein [Myxococcales bacterium]
MSADTDILQLGRVLKALANRCQTDGGAQSAVGLIRARDAREASQRLGRIEEATRLAEADLAPALYERLSFSDACHRAARGGVLDGGSLRPLGALLRCGVRVADANNAWREVAPTLADEAKALPTLRHLAFALSDAFDEDDNLVDEASDELARLRQDVRRRSVGLRKRIAHLMKDSDEQGLLQDDYWTVRDGRYVLPVKSSDKRAIGGIVHGSSHTGQTVYVEPTELVVGNNALALAIDAVKREEHRILSAFSEAVGDAAEDIARLSIGLARIDLIFAAAQLAHHLGACRPTLSSRLNLRQARHAVLLLEGVKVIANSIALQSPASWLVVSGPNGGGKTIALTTVGLAVEMAAHGLYICAAEGSEVPWVSATHVVLGDAQDLDQGLSTFSGHLGRIQGALTAAGEPTSVDVDRPPALILLDELAAGTEPSAGAALARAVLEAFADRHCLGLASTHFEAVKLLAVADQRFANAALKLDGNSLTPSFQLEMGAVGSSSPLALAARMGLDKRVVDRASALIGGGGQETERLLEQLQAMRADLEEELRVATRQRELTEAARQRLEDQRRAEKRAVERRINQLAGKAIDELEGAMKLADEARRKLADPKFDGADVARLSRRLAAQRKLARAARTVDPAHAPMRSAQLDAESLSPGDTVFHIGLRREATVLEVDVKRGRARVSAGGLEVRALVSELRPAQPKKTSKKQGWKPQSGASKQGEQEATMGPLNDDDTSSFRRAEWTCDLRGLRVDEAISQVDRHLDRAMMGGVIGVCIVHGIGTGAVRSAVTRHLGKHAQVDRHRLGRRGEGGDGATMVWMKRG